MRAVDGTGALEALRAVVAALDLTVRLGALELHAQLDGAVRAALALEVPALALLDQRIVTSITRARASDSFRVHTAYTCTLQVLSGTAHTPR